MFILYKFYMVNKHTLIELCTIIKSKQFKLIFFEFEIIKQLQILTVFPKENMNLSTSALLPSKHFLMTNENISANTSNTIKANNKNKKQQRQMKSCCTTLACQGRVKNASIKNTKRLHNKSCQLLSQESCRRHRGYSQNLLNKSHGHKRRNQSKKTLRYNRQRRRGYSLKNFMPHKSNQYCTIPLQIKPYQNIPIERKIVWQNFLKPQQIANPELKSIKLTKKLYELQKLFLRFDELKWISRQVYEIIQKYNVKIMARSEIYTNQNMDNFVLNQQLNNAQRQAKRLFQRMQQFQLVGGRNQKINTNFNVSNNILNVIPVNLPKKATQISPNIKINISEISQQYQSNPTNNHSWSKLIENIQKNQKQLDSQNIQPFMPTDNSPVIKQQSRQSKKDKKRVQNYNSYKQQNNLNYCNNPSDTYKPLRDNMISNINSPINNKKNYQSQRFKNKTLTELMKSQFINQPQPFNDINLPNSKQSFQNRKNDNLQDKQNNKRLNNMTTNNNVDNEIIQNNYNHKNHNINTRSNIKNYHELTNKIQYLQTTCQQYRNQIDRLIGQNQYLEKQSNVRFRRLTAQKKQLICQSEQLRNKIDCLEEKNKQNLFNTKKIADKMISILQRCHSSRQYSTSRTVVNNMMGSYMLLGENQQNNQNNRYPIVKSVPMTRSVENYQVDQKTTINKNSHTNRQMFNSNRQISNSLQISGQKLNELISLVQKLTKLSYISQKCQQTQKQLIYKHNQKNQNKNLQRQQILQEQILRLRYEIIKLKEQKHNIFQIKQQYLVELKNIQNQVEKKLEQLKYLQMSHKGNIKEYCGEENLFGMLIAQAVTIEDILKQQDMMEDQH